MAGLWCSTDTVLQTLDQATLAQNTGRSVFLEFIDKWFADLDSVFGLHDRKVSVLGLCTLLQMASKRPHDISQVAPNILPSICLMLENLEKIYAERAQEEADEDDSDEEYESGDADLDG